MITGNASNICVNYLDFVDRYVNYHVDESIDHQFNALKRGVFKIYGGNSLKLCQSSELEMIICGNNSNAYNFTELKDIAKYVDGYGPNHKNIVYDSTKIMS